MSEIRIAYHASAWGENNFLECLKDLADVGFRYVETSGDIAVEYYDKLYAFKGILGSSRLLAMRGQGELINPETREKEIGYNKSICEFLADNKAPIFVLSGARPPQGTSPDDFKRLADFCNEVGEFCSYLQIKACIHAAAGRIIETRADVDKIMEMTEPRLVYLCPDTAGPACPPDNPADLFNAHISRIPHIYFKDRAATNAAAEGAAQPDFVELGRGLVNFHAVVDALLRGNYGGSITVELENGRLAPKESAAITKKYIETELSLRVDPRPVPVFAEEAARPAEQKQPVAAKPPQAPPGAPRPAAREQQAPQPPEKYVAAPEPAPEPAPAEAQAQPAEAQMLPAEAPAETQMPPAEAQAPPEPPREEIPALQPEAPEKAESRPESEEEKEEAPPAERPEDLRG